MTRFSNEERAVFKKLSDPRKIQDFLTTIQSDERRQQFVRSPRLVLRDKKAYCLEGALFAACALAFHGEKPLLLDLVADKIDDGHVVALYKRNGYWGAISKTNHATLRFRDPIYKTVRELALSYFHEYFVNRNGEKTLKTYSEPVNLRALGKKWMTSEEDIWYVNEALDRAKHTPLVPRENVGYLRRADPIEREAGAMQEWEDGKRVMY